MSALSIEAAKEMLNDVKRNKMLDKLATPALVTQAQVSIVSPEQKQLDLMLE